MKRLIAHGARTMGPYLLVELLLPGGTMIALLLWVYRNQGKATNLLVYCHARLSTVFS